MRIKKIVVKNLFGYLNHEINFNLNENISIIYGLNGLGKTTILNIIKSLFSDNLANIFNYNFKEFVVYFENDDNIIINIIENDKIELRFKDKFYTLSKRKKTEYDSLFIWNSENYLKTHRIKNYIENPILDIPEKNIKFKKDIPKDFIDYRRNALFVKFIETNRLFQDSLAIKEHNFEKGKSTSLCSVEKYSKELQKNISDQDVKYSKFSQEKDGEFFFEYFKNYEEYNNLIKKMKEPDLYEGKREAEYFNNKKEEELKKSTNELSILQKDLLKSGLLETSFKEIEINELFLKHIGVPALLILFEQYIKSMKEKLEIYSDYNKRISMFLEIINNKLLNKYIKFSKQSGIIVINKVTNQELKITELSSGEQQIIVLYYKLIFDNKRVNLFLIDEPEISMHIMWQQEFIDDILNIQKEYNYNVIIATHSPQIINNHWNLTQEIKNE